MLLYAGFLLLCHFMLVRIKPFELGNHCMRYTHTCTWVSLVPLENNSTDYEHQILIPPTFIKNSNSAGAFLPGVIIGTLSAKTIVELF